MCLAHASRAAVANGSASRATSTEGVFALAPDADDPAFGAGRRRRPPSADVATPLTYASRGAGARSRLGIQRFGCRNRLNRQLRIGLPMKPARARDPNLVGLLHGCMWGVVAGLILRDLGIMAIVLGIIIGAVAGIIMRYAYSQGNRYRDP